MKRSEALKYTNGQKHCVDCATAFSIERTYCPNCGSEANAYYLPTKEQIRQACYEIRKAKGHVFDGMNWWE